VSVGYGDLLSVAARDNLEIELATDVEGGQEQSAAEVKTGSKLKVKIGRQMNGATVDAIEAGATAEQLRALFNPSPASPSTNQDSSGSTM
jgi:hypothetical protein